MRKSDVEECKLMRCDGVKTRGAGSSVTEWSQYGVVLD
jgi:hypothetical protein